MVAFLEMFFADGFLDMKQALKMRVVVLPAIDEAEVVDVGITFHPSKMGGHLETIQL